MVKIKGIKAFRPVDAESFVIKPYDVIGKEEELLLKKNPNSAIHVILPDGTGDEVYVNAERNLKRIIDNKLLIQDEKESVYLYRQESSNFSHEGIIFGVSLKDYEEGRVKRNEHTRDKPLKDRIAHITSTKMNTGVVWTSYKKNQVIEKDILKIKENQPIVDIVKYGYRHILWKIDDQSRIGELKSSFEDVDLYIDDGHHRSAAAAAYRKKMMEATQGEVSENENWNYFMVYAASNHQVRILPYNRVIIKLNMEVHDFIEKISVNFLIEKIQGDFKPTATHEIGMFIENNWMRLTVKKKEFDSFSQSLDVSILQELIISPILDIKDIRNDENIFFVGGLTDPKDMASFVTEKGNSVFFSLFPVSIKDLEKISDLGTVMPPKSAWFDPKLLSGLLFNPLF